MRLISTRGRAPAVDLLTALRRGLAPDGGLYMPTALPPLGVAQLDAIDAASSLSERARLVFAHLLASEIDGARLEAVLDEALDFPIPLVELDARTHVLELFHGPTLAFKDVAARVMARLLPMAVAPGEPLLVLTATSGDTGGAVAQAFHGVDGVRVAVLYPRGRITDVQERQIGTLGGNVRAFAVEGSFDDCQRLVKGAFADAALTAELGLTSANSINIGRLLPQAVYYFHALAQLRAARGREVVPFFVTPSGNFGNLTAGLIAHRLGLPAAGFLAATNANDVVPAFLETGRYRPRPSLATLSSAMDVGDPSNWSRIRHLFDDDLARLRATVEAVPVDDVATRETIEEVARVSGYVLDPHTAVGIAALERHRSAAGIGADTPCIVLSTAHPIKFRAIVEPAIGRPLDVPARVAALDERPLDVAPLPNDLAALREALLGG